MNAIVRVYADESNFNFKGRRGSVEMELGLFSAIAVLVKCDVGQCISARASRNIVQRLRMAAEASDVTSILPPSSLVSPQEFLCMLNQYGKIGSVRGLLMTWALERKETHDGVAVAFLLLHFGNMSNAKVLELYPTSSYFRIALLSLCKRNRSFKELGDQEFLCVPSANDLPWMFFGTAGLPLGFLLAADHFARAGLRAAREGHRGPLGLTVFWNDILPPDLSFADAPYEQVLLSLKILSNLFGSLRNSGDDGEFLESTRWCSLSTSPRPSHRDQRVERILSLRVAVLTC